MTTTDILKSKEEQYPEFSRIFNEVKRMNPLQAKRLSSFLVIQDESYWKFCEDLSTTLNKKLFTDEVKLKQAVDAYNELCLRMLRDQIQFRKTGVYQTNDATVAQEQVYENSAFMSRYMIGLLLTQMLWGNHYQLFKFFQSYLAAHHPQRYLEVGAGHGLFLMEAKRRFPSMSAVVCDLSATSIEICQDILRTFGVDPYSVDFRCEDFLKADFGQETFDFVTAGEVLEHVNDAPGFLERLRALVHSKGKMYLSTCANCPAPDHVYHFRNITEIRDLIRNSGFVIEQEIFLPAEEVPAELCEEQLVTINYAAILRPKQ